MARIAGVDIPDNKRGEIGLTYIFGQKHCIFLPRQVLTGIRKLVSGTMKSPMPFVALLLMNSKWKVYLNLRYK